MTFRLDIDFDEAIFGSERTLELTLPAQCPECKGSGAAAGDLAAGSAGLRISSAADAVSGGPRTRMRRAAGTT